MERTEMTGIAYKWLAKAPRAQISEKYRFFFVHIPKCGGTSFDEMDVFQKEYLQPRSGHRNLKFFIDTLEERIFDFRGFTIVRNPWDRFVSAYAYLINGGSGSPQENKVANLYIRPHSDVSSLAVQIRKTPEILNSIGHLQRSSNYCNLVLLSDEKLRNIFFVAHLENLNNEKESLAHHLRLPELHLKHLRRGSYNRKNYPPELKLSNNAIDAISDI